MEAAQGLLSMPAVGLATSTKMATQASSLADELLAAAVANRSNLTALVRSEVDAAIMARLGLVPLQKFEEAQAEAAELRQEVAALRSTSRKAAPTTSPTKASAPAAKRPAKKATAAKRSARKTTAAKTPAKKTGTAQRSAVTTRAKPAGS
jgi:hypothetical protein